MRNYNIDVPEYYDVLMLEEWQEEIAKGTYTNDNAYAWFGKDGKMSIEHNALTKDVDPEDATHVAVWTY